MRKCLASVLIATMAGSGLAQGEEPSHASVGDTIRVDTGAGRVIGILVDADAKAITFKDTVFDRQSVLALDTVRGVEILKPVSRGRNAAKGAAWGAIGGAVIGTGLGLASAGGDCYEGCSAAWIALDIGIITAISAAVGAIVGSLRPPRGTRWQRIDHKRGFDVSGTVLPGRHRLGVRIAFAF